MFASNRIISEVIHTKYHVVRTMYTYYNLIRVGKIGNHLDHLELRPIEAWFFGF